MSSSPQDSVQRPRRTQTGSQRPARRIPWFPLLLISAVVFGTYVYFEGPREIGRWYLAAANEHWAEGEYAAIRGEHSRATENQNLAFVSLERALKWTPDKPDYILQRAQWRTAAGKHQEALEDCNLLLADHGETVNRLLVRATIFQHLGRHADAVEDYERIASLAQKSGDPSRGEVLNALAYIKAVGNLDLSHALSDADRAVREARAEVEQNERDDMPPGFVARLERLLVSADRRRDERARTTLWMRLDTRGFIKYRLGDYAQALRDLEPAADGFYGRLAMLEASAEALRKQEPDPRGVDSLLAKEKETAAVVLYHRALVHQALGHLDAAAADRQKVKELIGREGDESLF